VPLPGFGVNNIGVVAANIGPGVSAGRYVGPLANRAYSFRAWVRMAADFNNVAYGFSAGVRAKAVDPVFVMGSGVWEGYNGYRLVLTTSSPVNGVGYNGLRLVLFTGEPGPGNGVLVECSGGPYVPDTWYRIRLDITPVGLNQDNLEAYLFDPNLLTWVLVGQQTVLSTQIGIFAPWADPTRRCGYYSSVLGSGAGFFQNARAWFDLVEAASEPV